MRHRRWLVVGMGRSGVNALWIDLGGQSGSVVFERNCFNDDGHERVICAADF